MPQLTQRNRPGPAVNVAGLRPAPILRDGSHEGMHTANQGPRGSYSKGLHHKLDAGGLRKSFADASMYLQTARSSFISQTDPMMRSGMKTAKASVR